LVLFTSSGPRKFHLPRRPSGDFAAAEAWYRKSLTIKEKQGNEHGAAITNHQLGRIA
jgi:hypothetical protein